MPRIKQLQDVVDWGLCTGCGACAYACPQRAVVLVNVESVGIRPRFTTACGSCTECLLFCPGYSEDAELVVGPGTGRPSDEEFGPASEIWEGHAADGEIRYRGSSGGVLSALALYCVEREGMGSVLHTGADLSEPWLNRTVQSRTRAELLSRAGSRYSPASPCDGLAAIEISDKPCVFIGKPCDTAAVMALRKSRPALDRRLGLVLAFFCAGTPSTRGTLSLLERMNVPCSELEQLRYRGEGWPGSFTVISKRGKCETTPYQQAWPALTHFVSLRCHLCPDGLGRVADIACGDAWEKYDATNGNPGLSIALVRTARGREILHRAQAAGYLQLIPSSPQSVLDAQRNLLTKRRSLFGRLLALRLLCIPSPRFSGFSLSRSWLKQPLSRQFRDVGGTLRRMLTRGWWKRCEGEFTAR